MPLERASLSKCSGLLHERGNLKKPTVCSNFQVMVEQGWEPGLESYNALLCAYERTGLWEDAVRTFLGIQDRGLTPDVMSWSSLISACANAGQPERALELLEKMKGSNCAPNVVSWCGLLKAYQKTGNWEKAEETFHAMLDSGCPPNEVLERFYFGTHPLFLYILFKLAHTNFVELFLFFFGFSL